MIINTNFLLAYEKDVSVELHAILDWWIRSMPDEENGGFYASMSNDNMPNVEESKGVVLNSRICWTFSTACLIDRNEVYLDMAYRAYQYIKNFFIDKDFGGTYWTVDRNGNVLDGKKQIYGNAFTIYALAEYYKVSRSQDALDLAKNIYSLIEKNSFDEERGGYIEALARDWTAMDDLRLSDKDANEKKSMNTHLHIVEAYANLFMVWPNEELRKKIVVLLEVFTTHIINKKGTHLDLFFNEKWHVKSSLISFGHDIEASWLLQECAEIINDEALMARYKKISLDLVKGAEEGLDAADGGLWYEYDPLRNELVNEKHWWPQAEAMVGFLNAYQLTDDESYLIKSRRIFDFIINSLKDNTYGEWYWGVGADGKLMEKEKAGFWKCPYHNVRACIEVKKRIKKLSL